MGWRATTQTRLEMKTEHQPWIKGAILEMFENSLQWKALALGADVETKQLALLLGGPWLLSSSPTWIASTTTNTGAGGWRRAAHHAIHQSFITHRSSIIQSSKSAPFRATGYRAVVPRHRCAHARGPVPGAKSHGDRCLLPEQTQIRPKPNQTRPSCRFVDLPSQKQ